MPLPSVPVMRETAPAAPPDRQTQVKCHCLCIFENRYAGAYLCGFNCNLILSFNSMKKKKYYCREAGQKGKENCAARV